MNIDIYPLTIVQDRYTGAYSGGRWLAFNLDPWDIPEDPWMDDVSAGYFWEDLRNGRIDLHVGIGSTKSEAVQNLQIKLERNINAINREHSNE